MEVWNLKRIIVVLLILISVPAWGQEFSILGGIVRDTEQSKNANTLQLEYMNTLKGPVAYSLSYLNEGHFPDSHRDGLITQLWAKFPLFHSSLELKGGMGPYLYFDTNERFTGSYYKHEHGFGAVFSLGADWRFRKPFSLQVRSNWILTENNFNTLSFLVGLGVELDRKPDNEAGRESLDIRANKNEVTPFVGLMASNNNDDNEHAASWGLEYRRALGRYINWTVAWMDEGDNDLFHRRGIATQVWAGDVFYGDRVIAGIGFGPYLALNAYRDGLTGKDGDIMAGLLSISIAYRLNTTWAIRGTWNRVITDYDRDSDVFWIGPTFRF